MANEITKVTDQNGVDHPFKDVAAFPRSEQAVLGAKQFYNIDAPALLLSNVTATKSNNGWQVQTSASATYPLAIFPVNIPANTDIRFSCGVAITSGSSVISIDGSNDGSSYTAVKQIFSPAANVNEVFNSGNYKYYRMRLFANFNETASTDGDILYSDILFTLASDTDRTVVRYAMTNEQLTDAVNNKISKTIKEISSATVDLNDVTETGFYIASAAPVNAPEGQSYFNMLVLNSLGGGVVRQIVFAASGSNTAIYIRTYSGNTWKNWVKFTGTEIS